MTLLMIYGYKEHELSKKNLIALIYIHTVKPHYNSHLGGPVFNDHYIEVAFILRDNLKGICNEISCILFIG